MSRYPRLEHSFGVLSSVRVSASTVADLDGAYVLTVWSDNPHDGLIDIWLTTTQLAQFCQQADKVWVSEFMGPQMEAHR